MEPHDPNDDELLATLKELRPEPRAVFTEELDARAAAGFPRRSRLRALSPAAALGRLRGIKARRVLLPAGAVTLTAIAVATVLVAQNSGEQTNLNVGTSFVEPMSAPPHDTAGTGGSGSRGGSHGEAEEASGGDSVMQSQAEVPKALSGAGVQASSGAVENDAASPMAPPPSVASAPRERKIERSASIVLGTEPEDVGKASSEVFAVVHDHRGIVLSSRTQDGEAGRAEATFELMIPSGKLGDAMAGFSAIGEVRSRQEATADITAPTVNTAEQLEDSQARIDSLLAQLAGAESEGEREAVEAELRGERRQAAALRAQLQNLDRRASLSRVSLRIVGGEGSAPDAGGAWGVGDALDDAGRILAVGAGVALLALAILAPFALLALLAWLARRTYLRRARQSALS